MNGNGMAAEIMDDGRRLAIMAPGLTDAELEALQQEVERSRDDPDYVIFTNYAFSAEDVLVRPHPEFADDPRARLTVMAPGISDLEMRALKEKLRLAAADPEFVICVPYVFSTEMLPVLPEMEGDDDGEG